MISRMGYGSYFFVAKKVICRASVIVTHPYVFMADRTLTV